MSTQGMIAETMKADIYTNNLANASTNGFKRDELSVGSSFAMELMRVNDHKNSPPSMVGPLNVNDFDYRFQTNFSKGVITDTGNPLDLFIEGDGFFTIEGKNAELYTRNGNFTLNSKGELVTGEGYRVLGEKGPVTLPPGKEIIIDEKGNIQSGGKIIDRLLVKQFPAPEKLVKLGESFYFAGLNNNPETSDAVIKQGYLEGSNVNTVKEMINLLEAQKTYQANERSIKAQFDALDEAVTSVGRVG